MVGERKKGKNKFPQKQQQPQFRLGFLRNYVRHCIHCAGSRNLQNYTIKKADIDLPLIVTVSFTINTEARNNMLKSTIYHSNSLTIVFYSNPPPNYYISFPFIIHYLLFQSPAKVLYIIPIHYALSIILIPHQSTIYYSNPLAIIYYGNLLPVVIFVCC